MVRILFSLDTRLQAFCIQVKEYAAALEPVNAWQFYQRIKKRIKKRFFNTLIYFPVF